MALSVHGFEAIPRKQFNTKIDKNEIHGNIFIF